MIQSTDLVDLKDLDRDSLLELFQQNQKIVQTLWNRDEDKFDFFKENSSKCFTGEEILGIFNKIDQGHLFIPEAKTE